MVLLDEGGVLTVFDHHDAGINAGEIHTAGRWDSAPTYSSGTDTTTFTNSNGDFPDHSIGWTLQPDARHSVFFEIAGITDTTITVRGDATSQVHDDLDSDPVWYFIIPPVSVEKEKETAALDPSPEAYPSRYLAFHYRYMPPMAGVSITNAQNSSVTPGIHGDQEGLNHQGQYQAWHRMYNPTTGRWTTPDPAAAPWMNLLTYVHENPVSRSDPTGLLPQIVTGSGAIDLSSAPYSGAYDPRRCRVNVAKLAEILAEKIESGDGTQADHELLQTLELFRSRTDNWERVTIDFDCSDLSRPIWGRPHAACRNSVTPRGNSISLVDLAHEMTHIWQQGRTFFHWLWWLISIGITETIPNELGLRNSYALNAEDLRKAWSRLTYEQQAQVMQYYVLGVIMGRPWVYVLGYGWMRTDGSDPAWNDLVARAREFLGEE